MVIEGLRRSYEVLLSPLAKALSFIPPDVFSLLSLLFAIVAGALYYSAHFWVPADRYPWLLLLALGAVALNALADTMDGRVARLIGKTSAVGDFLDHTFDRFSDIAILVGIAFSTYCSMVFGLLAVISVLLSSYMGTQAQALGCKRNYSGVLSRADRMILLMVVTPLQFLLQAIWETTGVEIFGSVHRFTPLEMLMGVMLVGGIITTLTRGWDTYKALKGKGDRGSPCAPGGPPPKKDKGR